MTTVTRGGITYTTLILTPLPSPTSTPNDLPAPQNYDPTEWIIVGAVGGALLLLVVLVLPVCMALICKRIRKKKTYTINDDTQTTTTSGSTANNSTSKKCMHFLQPEHNIAMHTLNKHAAVVKTESGCHTHIEVVNRGYMLASNEPHSNDRVKRRTQEKQEEDYDSDYSEVAITTGLQEASQSIAVTENVAYNLDEMDMATLNTALHTKTKQLGSDSQRWKQTKKAPMVRSKPRSITASGCSQLEASDNYDYPYKPHVSESVPVGVYGAKERGGSLVYDVPKPRECSNQQLSVETNEMLYQNQQEIYYNQTGQLNKGNQEVIYCNQRADHDQGDSDEDSKYYNHVEVIRKISREQK